MRAEDDAMMLIRAELCERLHALQGMTRRLSVRDFDANLSSLKLMAAAYGLVPVVRLAEALQRAAAGGEGACPRSLYLHRLQDAIGCERLDEEAGQAMLASVSVRLSA
jgi:hypothetical protein